MTLENEMKRSFPNTRIPAEAFASKPIRDLIRKRHSEIWHACRLIGGYGAASMVDKCAIGFETHPHVDDEVAALLERILATLTLENPTHSDRPFIGAFAVIDPLDPVVEEIRGLADELRGAMDLAIQRQRWATARSAVIGDGSCSDG